ncbi:dGTPase [Pseudomonas sp. S2_A02]
MEYSKIISGSRLRSSTANRDHNIIAETESDKARILFSAPFRRLQKKAQVFPLESNAAVRSRLTHTLEVATVGRQIAQKISKELADASKIADKEAFVNIVESACLLHDIGNPPFGHFGESAISNWFKNKAKIEGSTFHSQRKLNHDYYIDFENFDGNAQGLRIMTKLQGEDQFGLNLTCSTIAAYLKYTHPEHSRNKETNDFHKKPGFFLTEEESLKEVWTKLEIPFNTRSPLTFIMEAADDIAYCLSDIEDGIEKEIITYEELIKAISSKLSGDTLSFWNNLIDTAEKNSAHVSKFISIRTHLINRSTELAKSTFLLNQEAILSGDFFDSLINEDSYEYKVLKAVRDFVARHVYTSPEAEIIELSGNSIITGLLDKLSPLLEMSFANFEHVLNKDVKKVKENGLQIEARLLNLLPEQCKKSYRADSATNPGYEWIYRTHFLVDYISGMTDDFALEMYQKLAGIRTT